jgi:deoxyribodipyrimidine photo-lyase
MSEKEPLAIFWFRRDLRLEDNKGLFHALNSGLRVLPLFIFDRDILDRIEDKNDRRVSFIHGALSNLQERIVASGSSLRVFHDTPVAAFKKLISEHDVRAVYANHCYEPYAINRDQRISEMLIEAGIAFHTFKDEVIFEKDEVLKADHSPYTVFTPYSRAWKKLLNREHLADFPAEKLTGNLVDMKKDKIPDIEDIGFNNTSFRYSTPVVDPDIIRNYHLTRDIPSIEGTSRLGVHLRFGTVSIRQLVMTALSLNETWLNELIWREFFMSILWHFPHVIENSFRRKYDNINWLNGEKNFGRWCNGMTGYPIVDAGMRELNETGFMHNRVRMITASFLTKHLLTDWRWGEAYFAEKLLDYELSSNNGNWQWAAGTGCDAAPYFRIFNPETQSKKYDPELKYIRKWVPEYGTSEYPRQIVDHNYARDRALKAYSLVV